MMEKKKDAVRVKPAQKERAKSSAMKELKRLSCEATRTKYPKLPEAAVCPPNYKVNTANGLTRAIIGLIGLSGGFATRISTTGQIRGGRWVKGTTRKGTADIHAIYKGLHLSIEVKIGKDKQSQYQKDVEREVNAAGGVYYVARDFQSFYDWIMDINEKSGGHPRPS